MKISESACATLLAALLMAPAAAGELTESAAGTNPDVARVTVRCARGQTIRHALQRFPRSRELVVTIEGTCVENVVVSRDRVTLRGRDSMLDGIRAARNEGVLDAALWVRGAHQVLVENLSLTGGYSGLLATDVNTLFLRLQNCRLHDNVAWGISLEGALVRAQQATFVGNGHVNVGVFIGSRLECEGCTLADPIGAGPLGEVRYNLAVLGASEVFLNDSNVELGGVLGRNSAIFVTDSRLEALPSEPVLSLFDATASLTRVEVGGQLRVRQGSNVQLAGVRQTRTEAVNRVGDGSLVTVIPASPAVGGPPNLASTVLGFELFDFARLSLQATSELLGDLSCVRGADAFCDRPEAVSGRSTCDQCPES